MRPQAAPTPAAVSEAYEVVMADRRRVPVAGTMTLGRDPGSTVPFADGTVSRRHARITTAGGSPVLEDAGSSHGTWVDGERVTGPVELRDGAVIRLGNQELVVERRRRDSEAGLTIVVPERPSGDGASAESLAAAPRLRTGYALKRLEASEGTQRWVLRDLRSDKFLRLSDDDGRLLELLDGRHSVLELMDVAEERFGPEAAGRIVRLLPDLAERGFLEGVGDQAVAEPAPKGRLGRMMTPRERVWPDAGAWIEELYRDGGWRLLTPVALAAIAIVAVSGFVAFAYLVIGRYGTPFVVASKIGLGGLVFLLGRLAVAAVHETAHGLAMASFGRRVGRAGFKLVMIFPYVFVDTSEAWFEPRRRRIAVTAAGPVSDAVLGATFALCCLVLRPGTVRDIFFQLAFAAYVGALVNMNPFIERDGYQILADRLGEPGLRRRAREELRRWLSREQGFRPSPLLVRYAMAGVAWSVVAACAAAVVSLRYRPVLHHFLPDPIVWAMLATVWGAVLAPALMTLLPPLFERRRRTGGAR
jgi:putative peptide zinc metalloprotease protein